MDSTEPSEDRDETSESLPLSQILDAIEQMAGMDPAEAAEPAARIGEALSQALDREDH